MAHAGMARMARAVWSTAGDDVCRALAASPEGTELILTGHSLGAGVASLLTLMLHEEASPALELASRVRQYYEFFFSRRSAMDEAFILSNLAPSLRRDPSSSLALFSLFAFAESAVVGVAASAFKLQLLPVRACQTHRTRKNAPGGAGPARVGGAKVRIRLKR